MPTKQLVELILSLGNEFQKFSSQLQELIKRCAVLLVDNKYVLEDPAISQTQSAVDFLFKLIFFFSLICNDEIFSRPSSEWKKVLLLISNRKYLQLVIITNDHVYKSNIFDFFSDTCINTRELAIEGDKIGVHLTVDLH
ncbi:MAG: hypothetical protein QW303_04085 [Nitrososphaerota archaeon]